MSVPMARKAPWARSCTVGGGRAPVVYALAWNRKGWVGLQVGAGFPQPVTGNVGPDPLDTAHQRPFGAFPRHEAGDLIGGGPDPVAGCGEHGDHHLHRHRVHFNRAPDMVLRASDPIPVEHATVPSHGVDVRHTRPLCKMQ